MPGDRLSKWWRGSVAAGAGVVVGVAVVGPVLAPHPVERAVGMPFATPGGDALLGADRLGRDVLSHVLTGGTQLLVVAAVIAVLVTVLSALLGTVAAVRPRAGVVIELVGDLVILLPAVLGILLVLTAWPQGGVAALITVALVFGVPYCARIFAAAAAPVANSGYVEAAIASGESLPHLVFREVLPNLRAVFLTQLGLRFVTAVYLVSTVAFLGLPALGPDNWAIMVRDNASGLLLNPWAVLTPSLAIAIVAVGVNLAVTGGPARGVRPDVASGGEERVDPGGDAGADGAPVVVDGRHSVEDESSGGVDDAPGTLAGVERPVRHMPPDVDRPDAVDGRPLDIRADSRARGVPGPEHEPLIQSLAASDEAIAANCHESAAVTAGGQGAGRRAKETLADRTGDVVVVEGLTVVGEDGVVLVAPLSFRLRAGTVVALTGASGAGKSTVMRALLGHLPEGMRHRGSVRVGGQEVFGLDPSALRAFRRKRVAYVGQDPGSELNPRQRVRTLLTEAAPTAAEHDHHAVLAQVGLDPTFLRRRCAHLSGGQQRRIALARAILRRPEILLLDEPLAGLHGALRAEIARLITDLATRESTTILLSGHDTTTIHALADTTIEVHPPGVARASGRACATCTGDAAASHDVAAVPSSVSGTAQLIAPEAIEGGDEEDVGTVEHSAGTRWPNSARDGVLIPAERARGGVVLRAEGIGASVAGREVLAEVDLELRAGEAVAVVGPSGAGKSTLARVLAGLHRSGRGVLEVRGVRRNVGKRRRITAEVNGIQLVTQNPLGALNPRRTVEQTLARPLRRIARIPRNEIPAHVTALLADVELPADLATRHPSELSGGQRQRVALARALAARPAVLLCDEITTALDPRTAAAIMTLLDRLRAEHGTAILLISHDMALVTRHCAELRTLDQGRVVESGAPAAVLANPAHQATADLLG